ncbi:hypothetical protein WJX82_004065 [Trebouxia sp. C0006]
MVVDDTLGKSPRPSGNALSQPADLHEYNGSSQKRRRLSFGHSPLTPAKSAEDKLSPTKRVKHRADSPTLSLHSDEEEPEAVIHLPPSTEMKVLNQELKSLKDELKQTRKANKMAEAEKAEAEKDIRQLRQQIAQLTGGDIENCSEEQLHQLGKVLAHAQVAPDVSRFEGDT